MKKQIEVGDLTMFAETCYRSALLLTLDWPEMQGSSEGMGTHSVCKETGVGQCGGDGSGGTAVAQQQRCDQDCMEEVQS